MSGLILLFWALLCHNPTHIPGKTKCPLQHVIVTTMDDDGNGDSGGTPPKPPTFPPPPPNPPGS